MDRTPCFNTLAADRQNAKIAGADAELAEIRRRNATPDYATLTRCASEDFYPTSLALEIACINSLRRTGEEAFLGSVKSIAKLKYLTGPVHVSSHQ